MSAQIDSACSAPLATSRKQDVAVSGNLNKNELFTWELDLSTDTFLENNFWHHFLNYPTQAAAPRRSDLFHHIHPNDCARAQSAWNACIEGSSPGFEHEYRIRDNAGDYQAVLCKGKVSLRDARGKALRMVGVFSANLTTNKTALVQVPSNDVLATVLDTVPQMVYWKNSSSKFLGCNPMFADYMGLADPTSIVGLGNADLGLSCNEKKSRDEDLQILSGTKERIVSIEQVIRDDGNIKWLEEIKVPLRNDEGVVIGVLGTVYDLTKRTEAEHEIERLAYYDSLTGLPNRRYFIDRLEEAQSRAQRHIHWNAVLFVGIDRFKNVNDKLGHAAGDRLLLEVGLRIRSVLRNEDIAARVEGDQFVVLCANQTVLEASCAAKARVVANKISVEMLKPFTIFGETIHTSATVGVALFSDGADTTESILQMANTAMLRGKEEGGRSVSFFNPKLLQAITERLHLETSLRAALQGDQFELHYQPQVDSVGKVLGAEALVRWTHPTEGNISTDRFIAVSEKSGQINDIGRWVLKEAVSALARWSNAGILKEEYLSINVSVSQFRGDGFVGEVCKLLALHPNIHQRLLIEVTESIAVADFDDIAKKIALLREAGALISIDDIGSGYSSLSLLALLPIDQIKIDRSFISGIGNGPHKEAIVASLLTLGKHLNYDVIAEGVETAEELRILTRNGCEHFQGYYFCKPKSERQFLRYCEENKRV